MYGEKVQDILATTQRLREKGYYKGRLDATFVQLGHMRSREGREEYALE